MSRKEEEWRKSGGRSGVGEFAFGFGDGAVEGLGGLDHENFSDFRDRGGFREVLKIEFDSLLEIGNGFLFGGTEAGHVEIEALGDVVGFFAVEGVVDVSHGVKNREKSKDDKEMGG